MLWQQILLTFWPWVEFQLLMAGDGFSSVVICTPLSSWGHMKPDWQETSLPSLSAAHSLAHHTCLSGELSCFFNAVLPVASSEWQAGTCEMDVQPWISARVHSALPHCMRGWAQGSLCAEDSSSEPHNMAMLSSGPAWSHLACSEPIQRCMRASAQLGKSAFKQDSLTLIAYESDIISESSSQKCTLLWCKSSSVLIIKEW